MSPKASLKPLEQEQPDQQLNAQLLVGRAPGHIPLADRIQKGRPFTVTDHGWVFMQAAGIPQLSGVREVVHNSLVAGATEIAITNSNARGGHVIITDNGRGMTKDGLVTCMEGYGSGENPRDKDKHMGIGLKAVAATLNPEGGVFVRSWAANNPDSSTAFEVHLGRLNKFAAGIVFQKGEEVVKVDRPARVLKALEVGKSGTQVELNDTTFDQNELLVYVNSRFLSFGGRRVLVGGQYRDSEAVQACGLIKAMEQGCVKTGVVKLESCTLFWGIRKTDAEGNALPCEGLTEKPLHIAWNGEVYRAGTLRRQMDYGIRSGGSNIILVVEAKGGDIHPNVTRTNFENWDEEAAQLEVAENLRGEIIDYMSQWESEHHNPLGHVDYYKKVFAYLDLGRGVPLPSGVDAGKDRVETGGRGRSRREEGEGGEGGGSGRRVNPARGLPTPELVDNASQPSIPCLYDHSNNVLKFNKDYPTIQALLQRAEDTAEKKFRGTRDREDFVEKVIAIMAAEVAHRFCVAARNGYELNPDQLTALCQGFTGSELYIHQTMYNTRDPKPHNTKKK